MVELGDRVKDKISGIRGIAVGITNYLYGCQRVSIQPETSKDGKPAEWVTVDEPQLEIIKKAVVDGGTTRAYGPKDNIIHRHDTIR